MTLIVVMTGAIVVALILVLGRAALADEPIVVRAQAGVSAPVKDGRVDHAVYDALLKKHVDANGLVDYTTWKANDGAVLERYLVSLAAARPETLADNRERLAFWINAYNALTLHGMLRFYPTKSIRDHVARLWGFHFWKDVRIVVGGEERSLDAIEHQILRKMSEPRIHFAIVCASRSCPRLLNEAYVGARLEAQLEENTRDFFGRAQNLTIDREAGSVGFSSILKWFGEDFGGSDRAKLDLAARYVRAPEDKLFLGRADVSVSYLDYDWGINDRASR